MNENELIKLAELYKLKIRVFDNLILVSSQLDEWIVQTNEYKIILKHKNKRFNTKSYHLQKCYLNGEDNKNHNISKTIHIIFNYICSHDEYILNYKWNNNIVKLINEIAISKQIAYN